MGVTLGFLTIRTPRIFMCVEDDWKEQRKFKKEARTSDSVAIQVFKYLEEIGLVERRWKCKKTIGKEVKSRSKEVRLTDKGRKVKNAVEVIYGLT